MWVFSARNFEFKLVLLLTVARDIGCGGSWASNMVFEIGSSNSGSSEIVYSQMSSSISIMEFMPGLDERLLRLFVGGFCSACGVFDCRSKPFSMA